MSVIKTASSSADSRGASLQKKVQVDSTKSTLKHQHDQVIKEMFEKQNFMMGKVMPRVVASPVEKLDSRVTSKCLPKKEQVGSIKSTLKHQHDQVIKEMFEKQNSMMGKVMPQTTTNSLPKKVQVGSIKSSREDQVIITASSCADPRGVKNTIQAFEKLDSQTASNSLRQKEQVGSITLPQDSHYLRDAASLDYIINSITSKSRELTKPKSGKKFAGWLKSEVADIKQGMDKFLLVEERLAKEMDSLREKRLAVERRLALEKEWLFALE